ncbi:MAG TPA: phosphoglucosamine mutase [Pyrinomonadaceae bacterium]|jgi:phosphoglucosamine mutase|nr:phosphoglucosamine mutase [Pyrinomonadaceae bacterium]
MKRLFGTDGMRGEAGKFPLDAQTVRRIGSSLARRLAESVEGRRAPRIVTGRDTRESGAWIEQAFMAGARDAAAECLSAGIITTPGVAYLARTIPADAGVVISASHNPYQDNGIKIFSPSGRKLDDATERLIEADIKALASHDKQTTQEAQPVEEGEDDYKESAALRERYLSHLREVADASGLSLAGLSIVLDCANGAAFDLAPALFEGLGARVRAINDAPDGRNINRDCGSLHIEGLQRTVLAERADLGVAFDGDADRALFVDGAGEFVDGDATLWIMAQYLASRAELMDGIIVATVMSNLGLELALGARGWRLLRTDVGDKYVLEELLRTGASVGGEQSGHIIFPRQSLAGDGMMTALFLLRAMHDTGMRLDQLVQGFKRYPQVLVNVRVREKLPFEEVEAVARAVEETKAHLGERGRLLLRYSGTEPLARVMIEGEQQELIERYANTIADAIREAIGEASSKA